MFVNMLGRGKRKAKRRSHVNIFMKLSMEESIINIKLF